MGIEKWREEDPLDELGKNVTCQKRGRYGIHGIKDFNISLLGKQFWRLMQSDDSLFERFFKGMYYPRCQITKALAGFKPSHLWHNILNAKEVVICGSRWRIDNEESVKIWKDNWIPTISDFKPISPFEV